MNSAEILKSTESDTFSANLISSDTDLLNKVKQVVELTGCSSDVAVTALFDSSYDVAVAIDKIFEQTQRGERPGTGADRLLVSDWKEVAKYNRKKPSTDATGGIIDSAIEIKDTPDNRSAGDKSRIMRGASRGRARLPQATGRSQNTSTDQSTTEYHGNKNSVSRGRGRRSQYRINTNSGRSKYNTNQENNVYDKNIDEDFEQLSPGNSNKWNSNYDTCNDWLSDNTVKSNDYNESPVKPIDSQPEDISHHNANSALNKEKVENHLTESCCIDTDNKNSSILKDEHLNPLELVAKATNKVDIFGGFSRTKPPAPSSKVPLEPVKLLTSTGVMSQPNKSEFNFSFGLNFNEYSQSAKSVDSSESFISKIISNQPFEVTNKPSKSASSLISQENRSDEFLSNNFQSEKESQLSSSSSSTMRIINDKSSVKPKQPDNNSKSSDLFTNSPVSNHRSLEISDKKLITDSPSTNYKLSENVVSNSHQSGLNTAILSTSSQLCAPPGMSNAHLLQQFQNNPQYFSLLNIPNGSSIFSGCNLNQVNDFSDITGVTDDSNQLQQSFIHTDSNKEFSQKTSNSKHNICNVQSVQNSSSINQNPQVMLSKISDSENSVTHSSTILSAMPMSNICCFPPVYMNNFANFMPTVAGGHNSSTQSAEVTQSSIMSNKPMFNLPTGHRNYIPDDYIDTNKYDEMMQTKQKYQRTQNFVSNFGGKSSQDDPLEVDKSTKLANNNTAQINRQPGQQQSQQQQQQQQSNIGSSNRANQHQASQQQQQQQQQSVSNDPRFLAFHHQHSNHPFQSNVFNCVTATGAHPTAPHPYAMAHQGGNLQQLHPQLHLMQQQMHNFPQSYQFQEHLMTPMVSNPNNRNNIPQGSGSSGNQSRSNRSNNQLWHPSN